MRWSFWLLSLLLCCGLWPVAAPAHSLNQGAVLLDFSGSTLEAEVQLPLARLETALGMRLSRQDLEQDRVGLRAYLLGGMSAALPDGRRIQVSLSSAAALVNIEGGSYVEAHLRLVAPAGASLDLFDLHCSLLVDRIRSQVILVSTRSDWRSGTFADEPQLWGVLRASETSVRIDRRGATWWSGFSSVFQLGMRHIAEGTDHLLFLLALLLPAPLLARRGRWAGCVGIGRCLLRIGQVVTAFTLGHSVTLALGALDVVHVPSRPIEALIAVSILVSAVHAVRPMFPGKEAVVAACFGVVHGLAFATTLAELGLGRWDRVAGILAFNVGIEVMQLVVVLAALPALILLSRTVLYAPLRVGGAVFAGVVAVGWIVERVWDVPGPADAVVEGLARHAGWMAVELALLGGLAWGCGLGRRQVGVAGPGELQGDVRG